ncbi:MAG TPA: hypothetical protein VFU02_05070 [Polyangiaceae bacterium]|nr:hypothetical protein [Polyangiaceae bacterium]
MQASSSLANRGITAWCAAVGLAATLLVSCKSFVNASPNLRWWLFANFGADQLCPEMLKRGAPLKLTPNGNTIGRFYPTQCRHDLNQQAQTVTVHFAGSGLAWTPIAGRVGFSASAAVEYRMDFYLGDDADYIWARTNRIVQGPDFQVGSVENRVVDWATKTPVGYLANTFGGQIVSSHLTSGFTVVRTEAGDEFSLGHLSPPQRPQKPFDTSSTERYVFMNETTEVQVNQIDMLGPFEVAKGSQSLFLRLRMSGPAIDVQVIHRGVGDLWRSGLQLGAPLAPPSQPPITSFTLQPGPEIQQRFKLAPGQYYVVLDNSSAVGSVKPPWNPLATMGASAAVVSYTAELAED